MGQSIILNGEIIIVDALPIERVIENIIIVATPIDISPSPFDHPIIIPEGDQLLPINLATKEIVIKSLQNPYNAAQIPNFGGGHNEVPRGDHSHIVKFTELGDVVNENYLGKSLNVPMVTPMEDALELTETQELETVLAKSILLADMPISLSGFAGYVLRVKQDETGYELSLL